MENNNQVNPISDSDYSDQLNKLEAQPITNAPVTNPKEIQLNVSSQSNCCSEQCLAKACVSLTVTLLLSPFAICDVYYAVTDNSCVNESQASHNLNITLRSYLLASGIIAFSFIGLLNFSIFIFDLDMTKSTTRSRSRLVDNDNETLFHIVLNIANVFVRTFGFAWLILGCVLFWAYTNLSDCSQSIHDYLFTRFILAIIFTCFTIKMNSE
jgi:hypothetical protein